VDSRRLDDSFPALDYFESRDIPFVIAVNLFEGNLFHTLADLRAALNVDESVRIVTTDARARPVVKETVLELLDVVLQRAVLNDLNAAAV
jgi:uncharacterized protein